MKLSRGQASSLHPGERNSLVKASERETLGARERQRRERRKGGERTKMHSPIKTIDKQTNKQTDPWVTSKLLAAMV